MKVKVSKKFKHPTCICCNYRKIKDLPKGMNNFCNSKIQGYKENLNTK